MIVLVNEVALATKCLNMHQLRLWHYVQEQNLY